MSEPDVELLRLSASAASPLSASEFLPTLRPLLFSRALLCVFFGAWLIAAASAQSAPGPTSRPAAAVPRPTIAVPRIELEGDARIVIDGIPQEAAWKRAVKLRPLTQVRPIDGVPATRKTEIRLCYDADFFYVMLRCFDERGEVRARLMQRDANLDPDDRVEIWFDSFGDQRFGTWFQIGAGGSRGDALISGGGDRFNKSWDGIWYGISRVTAKGWEAECAFPFKTLGFRKGTPSWGFNIRRHRKANGEEMRWASPNLAYQFFSLARGGRLTGLRDLDQGLGLDIVPYATGVTSRDRRQRKHSSTTGDIGVDAYWRVTPELRAVVTYNTDFAETEVDERQVNISRFPLFFPEKRDFFLADAGRYEFGLPSRGGGFPLAFFSRRIGLDSSGSEVPLLIGGKLAGSIGDWNIGALAVSTDRTSTANERGLGVVRVSRNVGEESSVGMIATGGDPSSDNSAFTAGVDAKLGHSEFFGRGRSWYNWVYLMGTTNEGPGGDGMSLGVQSEYRDSEWQHRLRYLETASDFDPALGFVRRRGQKETAARTQYTWRSDGVVRSLGTAFDLINRTFTNNQTESWLAEIDLLDIEFATGDTATIELRRFFERIPDTFEVGGELPIPPGDYTNTRIEAEVEASDRRDWGGRARVLYGGRYDGTLTQLNLSADLRFSAYILGSLEWQKFDLRTPRGAFRTEVSQARIDVNFTPLMSLRNLIQYDTSSKDLSAQSRFRWIFEPGNKLFLLGVYGWERNRFGGPLVPTTQDLTLKLVWTFRF